MNTGSQSAIAMLIATMVSLLFPLSTLAQPAREFFIAATQAGQNDRWKAINWQPDMEAAKVEAQRTHKPILIVMHNNFGGDTNSHEC